MPSRPSTEAGARRSDAHLGREPRGGATPVRTGPTARGRSSTGPQSARPRFLGSPAVGEALLEAGTDVRRDPSGWSSSGRCSSSPLHRRWPRRTLQRPRPGRRSGEPVGMSRTCGRYGHSGTSTGIPAAGAHCGRCCRPARPRATSSRRSRRPPLLRRVRCGRGAARGPPPAGRRVPACECPPGLPFPKGVRTTSTITARLLFIAPLAPRRPEGCRGSRATSGARSEVVPGPVGGTTSRTARAAAQAESSTAGVGR